MGLGQDTRGVSEIIHHFSPKQLQAFEALFDSRFVLYGGARGGGKSRWLRWVALLLLIYWYRKFQLKGVRVGLFCETYPDLRDRQITKIKKEFPLALGEVKETKEDGLCFFLNQENGGGMIALRNLDDPSKYQSSEFAAILVDELTKISKETFDILRGSLRWPGISHTVFAAGTNPGGVGHAWVKQLWIDKDFPREMRNIAPQFAFIQSLPADNPHLDQTYWDDLNSLPDGLRRAWVLGDWDVFAGMAFPSWRADAHVVDPFDIPAHWPRWRAIDWGFAKPWCCLWLTKDPDTERIYVYQELYKTELTDTQQAKAIKANTPQGKLTTYADPSMWSRKNAQDVITSTADEYAREGVALTKADNDRLSGKRKIDRVLGSLPDGKPGLQVFSTCANLIRTMPYLPRDEHNPEDVDTKAEDHAYDALRYGLTNLITQPANQRRPIERPPMARIRSL